MRTVRFSSTFMNRCEAPSTQENQQQCEKNGKTRGQLSLVSFQKEQQFGATMAGVCVIIQHAQKTKSYTKEHDRCMKRKGKVQLHCRADVEIN